MRREDELRRVLQALTTMQRTARRLSELPRRTTTSHELEDRLREAQTELIRAFPSTVPMPEEAIELLDKLVEIDVGGSPDQISQDAGRAWNLLAHKAPA